MTQIMKFSVKYHIIRILFDIFAIHVRPEVPLSIRLPDHFRQPNCPSVSIISALPTPEKSIHPLHLSRF